MRPAQNEEFVYEAVKSGELDIDSEGRIWRIGARRGNRWTGETHVIPCERRRAEHDTGSYLQVRVMRDKVRVYCMAHRLVWRHLRGRIPEGLTINHKNGQKKDNRPENLETATYSEQMVHAIDSLGQHRWMRDQEGKRNRQTKLTTEQVVTILMLREQILAEMETRHGKMISMLADKYGVSYQTVWDIVRGRRWASLG